MRKRASRMAVCSLFGNANEGVGVTAVQYQWQASGRVSQAFVFPRKGLAVSQAVPGTHSAAGNEVEPPL